MTAHDTRRFRAMLDAMTPGGGLAARVNRLRFRWSARKHRAIYDPIISAPLGTLLGRMADERPEILAFIRAPYFSSGWSADERLTRFAAHVATLEAHRPLDFPVAQSINLMPLTAIADTMHVVIDKPMWFHREGVLAINLFDGNTRLFTLVFAFELTATGLRALIGGIQGRNLPDILDRYRVLTKDAHGIRPRDLLIEIFRMLCARVEVTEIHAISDRGRHNRHPYFGGDVMRALPLNYDEIWLDRSGTAIDQWFFDLPLHGERRADTDIAPKKRSMYRQRYAMLDALEMQMAEAYATMTPVTRPDAD